MKRFYSLDGKRSYLVTQAQWRTRSKIQDAYIRRKGLIPFRNRSNKPYALTENQYRQRIAQVKQGRFYAGAAYTRLKKESTPEGQKAIVTALRREGYLTGQQLFPGERYYTGPSAVVSNMAEMGAYVAEVHDVLKIIKRVDGRDPIFVRTQMSWGDLGSSDRSIDSMRFVASVRGELTRVDQENDFRNTLAMAMALSDNIDETFAEALKKLYLKRKGQHDESELGELLEGDLGEDGDEDLLNFRPVEIRSIYAVTPLTP